MTIDEFFPFGLTNGDTAMMHDDDLVVNVSFQDRFLFYGNSYTFFGVSCVLTKHNIVRTIYFSIVIA